jgi:hypothetical protein
MAGATSFKIGLLKVNSHFSRIFYEYRLNILPHCGGAPKTTGANAEMGRNPKVAPHFAWT